MKTGFVLNLRIDENTVCLVFMYMFTSHLVWKQGLLLALFLYMFTSRLMWKQGLSWNLFIYMFTRCLVWTKSLPWAYEYMKTGFVLYLYTCLPHTLCENRVCLELFFIYV